MVEVRVTTSKSRAKTKGGREMVRGKGGTHLWTLGSSGRVVLRCSHCTWPCSALPRTIVRRVSEGGFNKRVEEV